MTLPPPPPPAPVLTIHEPVPPELREPPTRRPVIFWDRAKVTVLLLVFLGLSIALKASQIPLMSLGEVIDDQLRAKWLVLALIGVELVRQAHYLVCERSAGYHGFWQRRVWGAWNRRMDRVNPWKRYRLNRAVKTVVTLTILAFFFAWRWGVSPVEAVALAPSRAFNALFAPLTGGLPLFWMFILYSVMGLFSLVIFYAVFFIGGVETYKPGEIKTRFSDVWGQDPVLQRVRETVDYLERPAEIERKGGHVPGGILLWGPPGTGKTLMAEAIAGETGKPYMFVDPSAFIQTFLGVAPMKIKWMYRKIRKLALRYGGIVVFFDEADALGNRGNLGGGGKFDFRRAALAEAARTWEERHVCNGLHYADERTAATLWHHHVQDHLRLHREQGDDDGRPRRIILAGMGGGGAGMGALQALLTEMSGLNKPRGFFSRRLRSFLGMPGKKPPKYRILHVMATNMPNSLDEALLRPGRIDRIYKVGYPHLKGRIRTFEGYLDKVRHCLTPAEIERIALTMPYASGAKIKDTVNEALIVAMREGRDVITFTDLVKAKHLKAHGEADDWAYGDLERHKIALHEACHAAAMYLLQKRSVIDIATIERRGGVGGFVAPVPLEERFSQWMSEKEITVMTFLASLVGERMFFEGDNSNGVAGDLQSATAIVTEGMAFVGMGNTLASRSVTVAGLQGVTGRPEDGADRHLFDTAFGEKVEAKLAELYERTEALLREHRWFVLGIAHALEQHLTITGEDIDAIFKGRNGPVVNGWQYHTDDFKLSYEAYHLSALEAHKGQTKPNRALPVLSPNQNGTSASHGMFGTQQFEPPAPPATPPQP